ncbi:fibronectin type III domain-containing protein [Streptomyces pharetrae]|uniref:fibronectin type III domain-containing protein n=1 Tax=Streptomyces pharetrae TaxID=291370 RepID=UPI003659D0B4
MSVKEILQAPGSWELGLSSATPRDVLDAIHFFGHVAIVPGRLDPAQYGDQLLTAARYVGVVREKDVSGQDQTNSYRISGASMAIWLGDEDGKGAVYEAPVSLTAQTFANSIRALLPSSGAVTEGTLHTAAGTYTGTHRYEDPRAAITYVCGVFTTDRDNPVEWRVNGNGTLDAGKVSDLYVTSPTCVVASLASGYDMDLTAPSGSFQTQRDVEDFTTRVVLLAEGEGESIATGSADIVSNPYLDIHGNPVTMTRLVSESDTSTGNADARAQLQLNRFTSPRDALTLSADDYDIKGSFEVGDYVWVYDPDSGLVNTANEIVFRGQRINPVAIRVSETQWPITEGHTVAFRGQDGTWYDLTDYVEFESERATSITVGGISRTLTSSGSQPIGSRPSVDTSVPAAPPLNTPFSTSNYADAQGRTRSRIIAQWDQPLNTDGSTVIDGDHYEVRWRTADGVVFQYGFVAWGIEQFAIEGLEPGVSYVIAVRAVDSNSNYGAWSADSTTVAQADVSPPSTPAAPTVAGSALNIQVTHTLGKASGGTYNLENDLAALEVHVGTTAGFTASSATLRGTMTANAGMLTNSVAAVGTFPVPDNVTRYVRVIAVDRSGNKSPASASASVTALLIDTANIADAAITNAKVATLSASKLTAGTISSQEIVIAGGSAGILRSDNYTTGGTGSGWQITGDGKVIARNFRTGLANQASVVIGDNPASEDSGASQASFVWLYSGAADEAQGGYLYVAEGTPQTGNRSVFSTLRSPRYTSSFDSSARITLWSQSKDTAGDPYIEVITKEDGTKGRVIMRTRRIVANNAWVDVGPDGRLYFAESNDDYLAHENEVFLFREGGSSSTSVVQCHDLHLAGAGQLFFSAVGAANNDYISFDETTNEFRFFADSTDTEARVKAGVAMIGRWGTSNDSAVFMHESMSSSPNSYAVRQSSLASGGATTVNCRGGAQVNLAADNNTMVHFTTTGGGSNTEVLFEKALPTGTGTPVVSSSGQLVRDTSSIRWKENVEDLDVSGGLPVYGLRPVVFDWKAGVVTSRTRQAGLIAEEVQEQIPDAVVLNDDGEVEGLNNNVLVSHLIAAVKDLNGRLTALEHGSN